MFRFLFFLTLLMRLIGFSTFLTYRYLLAKEAQKQREQEHIDNLVEHAEQERLNE